MDGKPLDGLFTDAVTDRPIEWIETYDDPAGENESLYDKHPRSDHDARILEHLRSLGYIE
jgi:hypothetical protein